MKTTPHCIAQAGKFRWVGGKDSTTFHLPLLPSKSSKKENEWMSEMFPLLLAIAWQLACCKLGEANECSITSLVVITLVAHSVSERKTCGEQTSAPVPLALPSPYQIAMREFRMKARLGVPLFTDTASVYLLNAGRRLHNRMSKNKEWGRREENKRGLVQSLNTSPTSSLPHSNFENLITKLLMLPLTAPLQVLLSQ